MFHDQHAPAEPGQARVAPASAQARAAPPRPRSPTPLLDALVPELAAMEVTRGHSPGQPASLNGSAGQRISF